MTDWRIVPFSHSSVPPAKQLSAGKSDRSRRKNSVKQESPPEEEALDRLVSLVTGGKSGHAAAESSRKSSTTRILEARNAWDAMQHLRPLFTELGLRPPTSQPPWLSVFVEAPHDKKCWLLAREILRFGNRLPTELEPFRKRADFEEAERLSQEETLAESLHHWILGLPIRSPRHERSLRIVWSWNTDPSEGHGPFINLLLSSKKLNAVSRTPQQMCHFAAECSRSPNLFNQEDTDFLRWLESQMHILENISRPASHDAAFSQNGRALHAWLSVWGQTDRCVWADGSPVRHSLNPVRIVPDLSKNSKHSTSHLKLAVELPDGSHLPLEETRIVLPRSSDESGNHEPVFAFVRGSFHRVATPPPFSLLIPFLKGHHVPLVGRRRSHLMSPLLARFPKLATCAGDLVQPHPVRIAFTFTLQDDDWLLVRLQAHSLRSRLSWEWTSEGWVRLSQDSIASTTSSEALHSPVKKAPLTPALDPEDDAAALPDPASVEPARQWLESLGFQDAFEAGFDEKPGWWMLINSHTLERLVEHWVNRPASGEFWANPSFRRLMDPHRRVAPRLKIRSSGVDWLSISSEWEALAQHLNAADLRKLQTTTEKYIKLSQGRWIASQEALRLQSLVENLSQLGLDPFTKEPQRITLWQLASARGETFDELVALLKDEGDISTLEALSKLRSQLASFRGIPSIPLPQRIRANLREYQLQGLYFLAYASSLQLGSILADDMGLGKTLQSLAWMESLRDVEGPAPCLVVCPASVVHNWQREAEKFVSECKTLILSSGGARHGLRSEIPRHDLVITNYALLRRDLEELKLFEFRAVILDEAQNIKNPDSMVARAAKQLRSKHRLALTGTPLENRMIDLWSITDFVVPGYLGSRSHFVEEYDVEDQPQRRRLLASRLRPMLLRRLKREVAPDLPDRIEERRDCELTEGQRSLYLTELQKAKEMVHELSDAQLFSKKKLHILAAITRLRQICCHPSLVDGKPELGSGKMNELLDLIEPLIAGGHKVLVFSQFVKMLNLLEDEFVQRKIPYHLLTGKTAKREEVVRGFQEDPQASVFLLSLRAAGTGLNLTAASYVFLYDPWWNPSVEAQAIDRTHRIGQDRTVIIYRLVAKGTVEDKIFQLQETKSTMVTDILGEEGFTRSLTPQDLGFLFSE